MREAAQEVVIVVHRAQIGIGDALATVLREVGFL
jgi:hypothetical protein